MTGFDKPRFPLLLELELSFTMDPKNDKQYTFYSQRC